MGGSERVPFPPCPPSSIVFNKNLFAGKVLLCSGGGGDICGAQTLALLKHGARAVILGRSKETLEAKAKMYSQESGSTCLAFSSDVRSMQSMQEAADFTVKEFGHIDYVICGAAGNFLSPISKLSSNAFRTVLEIDTLGTYNLVKATLPYLSGRAGSAYIHVSATLHYRGFAHQAHVGAAKAAVDALSNALAVEAGPIGVRSNVIAPGPIASTVGLSKLSKGNREKYVDNIPAGRFGTTDDIAAATLFLFSPAASWITGQILVVDGGERHTSGHFLPYPASILTNQHLKAKL